MSEPSLHCHEIRLGDVHYPYYYGYDCLDQIASSIGRIETDRFLILTDETVWPLHGAKLLSPLSAIAPVSVLTMPAGERTKSLSHLSTMLQAALRVGATRRSVVVAFGGGVPGNLAGVLAGLLFRGVRLVHVPTTTVAAMDSTLSLKQAINSDLGKNHIGTYLVPEAVYTDVQVLQSLPDRELRSGLCETAKNALAIRPQTLSELLRVARGGDLASEAVLRWLLEESLAAKLSVMRHDPKEQHAGLVLEYGHTVGHAIELAEQRRRGSDAISHGDAVALGMLAAARVSRAIGALSARDAALHETVVVALRAPTRMPPALPVDEVVELTLVDNKRGFLGLDARQVAMVLLRTTGIPLHTKERPLVPVPVDVVRDAVLSLCDRPDPFNRESVALERGAGGDAARR